MSFLFVKIHLHIPCISRQFTFAQKNEAGLYTIFSWQIFIESGKATEKAVLFIYLPVHIFTNRTKKFQNPGFAHRSCVRITRLKSRVLREKRIKAVNE